MASAEVEKLKQNLEISEKKRSLLKRYSVLKNTEPENTGLWMMVDLMTLVLVFFIYLYASKIDMHHTVTYSSFQGVTPVEQKYEKHYFDRTREHLAAGSLMSEAGEEFSKLMEGRSNSDYSVEFNDEELVLVIGEKISFNTGEAELLPGIEQMMSGIADILKRYQEYNIAVSGHTDNRPINSSKYPSNWELSAARAVNVAKTLIKNNVRPDRIYIEGYAQYAPKSPNNSDENRQKNRRVEISLTRGEKTF